MHSELHVFESKEFGRIRTVKIDGQPWFVGNDICDVFGETNRNRAMQALGEDEKGYTQMTTPGGKQQLAIVNESGLYSLLFVMKPSKVRGKDKEYIAEREAKLISFRRWVTSEVLPSIRKHGAYITDDTLRKMQENEEFTEELLNRLAYEKVKNNALVGKIEQLAPKANYYDIVLQCENAVQTSIIAKDYGMTCAAFNKMLHGFKIQYRVGETCNASFLYMESWH